MKDEFVYLQHILDCIGRIEEYTQEGRQAFLNQPLIQDAVMRNLEVIGEAASNVSPEFRRAIRTLHGAERSHYETWSFTITWE